MVTFDQVEPQDTLLLCRQPWLPYGEVPLIYGNGSVGKGRSVQSVTAAVTNGQPAGLDAGTEDEAGDVVMILPEDKRAESAVKRLIAAGADRSRVHDFTRLPDGTRFKLSATPRDAGHLPVLRAYVENLRAEGRNPRMVVIDPIGACIGEGTIQTSKGARYFAEQLQDFAEATGICLPLVAHPVGGGKLQGSRALEQALRVIYYVTTDEADSNVRVWRLVKGNDVPPECAGDARFTIVGGENGPHAVWLPPETRETQQQAWRERLAARRKARRGDAGIPLTPASPVLVPVSQGGARAAGCKHPRTKFGTPSQCGDCPAARLKAAPASTAGAAATYTASMTAGGRTVPLAAGTASLEFAQQVCELTGEAKALYAQGMALTWRQVDGQTWAAGTSTVGFAVTAEGNGSVAV